MGFVCLFKAHSAALSSLTLDLTSNQANSTNSTATAVLVPLQHDQCQPAGPFGAALSFHSGGRSFTLLGNHIFHQFARQSDLCGKQVCLVVPLSCNYYSDL